MVRKVKCAYQGCDKIGLFTKTGLCFVHTRLIRFIKNEHSIGYGGMQ